MTPKKLVSCIENTLNPFNETYQDKNIFCLSTGKTTSQTVKKKLLNIILTGREECEQFEEECFVNPTRFDKAIKLRKIRHFSSDAVKVTLAGKDKKIQEGTRHLFGRLVYLAANKGVYLDLVFRYPPSSLGQSHASASATAGA